VVAARRRAACARYLERDAQRQQERGDAHECETPARPASEMAFHASNLVVGDGGLRPLHCIAVRP
jgi:hypothetical protein